MADAYAATASNASIEPESFETADSADLLLPLMFAFGGIYVLHKASSSTPQGHTMLMLSSEQRT